MCSTYYGYAPAPADDAAILKAIAILCDEFECYGWRRVRAALQQQGLVVDHKIKRLMREHSLQPKSPPPPVVTTDSDHDQPIFPNRAKGMTVDETDRAVGRRHHLTRISQTCVLFLSRTNARTLTVV